MYRKELGSWKMLVQEKPRNGQDVILFIQDGRIIRTVWSEEADKMAVKMGYLQKGCYPLFWCPAITL